MHLGVCFTEIVMLENRPSMTTAVKRKACASGSNLGQSRTNFPRKMSKENIRDSRCHGNFRKKKWRRTQESVKENKNRKKETLRLFLPFRFEIYRKSHTFLIYRESLAFVVFCNSCEITWL